MSREIISIGKYIDQTLLKPTASIHELTKFCEDAKEYDFASVCIPPHFVAKAAEILCSTSINICTVIGFPLGYSPKEIKAEELKFAIMHGAEELDVVINQSLFHGEQYDELLTEMTLLSELSHSRYCTIKFIVETAYLSREQNKKAVELCLLANADFIKTSSGFASKGAELSTIKLWKKLIGNNNLKIKASGGIKNSKEAVSFISAGADRLGCSKGILIVDEYERT